jgi:hypothetical protein
LEKTKTGAIARAVDSIEEDGLILVGKRIGGSSFADAKAGKNLIQYFIIDFFAGYFIQIV